MFTDVTYDENSNTYQSIYKADDERTAKWIAEQCDTMNVHQDTFTMVFAYKRDVVISSKSEKAANQLRDRLNHDLAAIMTSIQEIDPEYQIKKCISCEVNNIRLSRR